jgi:hypothetical protein
LEKTWETAEEVSHIGQARAFFRPHWPPVKYSFPMDTNSFQRNGSISNSHVRNEFEKIVLNFFARQGLARHTWFQQP